MNCIFRGQKRRCGEWPRGRRSSNSRFLEEASQHDCRCQEQKQERFQTTLTFKPTFQQWPIIVKQCKASVYCWREQKLAYHHGKCTKSFQLYWLFKHCFKKLENTHLLVLVIRKNFTVKFRKLLSECRCLSY